MTIIRSFRALLDRCRTALRSVSIVIGKPLNRVRPGTLVFFPVFPNTLACGISALVAYKRSPDPAIDPDPAIFSSLLEDLQNTDLETCLKKNIALGKRYLGGSNGSCTLLETARALKTQAIFFSLIDDTEKCTVINQVIQKLDVLITREKIALKKRMAELSTDQVDTVARQIEKLEDTSWCLRKELLENIDRIRDLSPAIRESEPGFEKLLFKRINAVLNSLDRLEVRGRDSAGISLLFVLTKNEFEQFRDSLVRNGLGDQLKQRTNRTVLTNNTITIHDSNHPELGHLVSISIVYKYAAEIGALGDNVAFLRSQIRIDQILRCLAGVTPLFNTVSAHTRWASVGDITEANCHPVDNEPTDKLIEKCGIIHACLNGDIDNFQNLKTEYEERYDVISPDITTDTKIIPLQIEHYLKLGNTIEEAFRLAVNDFKGSHAISMHTDLAPGKLFLAQKGSGQALFVGIGPDSYIAASELYGLIEETPAYIKLNGVNNGQIMILDQDSQGGLSGLSSMTYDGTGIALSETEIQRSEITSRDIDRQDFPHYFLKEISEAPLSVEKTLQNKWKRSPETGLYTTLLDESVIPERLESDIRHDRIRRIYFIGQGTAGVAAQGCADILRHYLAGTDIDIRALKSSELSGFSLRGHDHETNSMQEYLVVAISQSGTTTDTNRTVDMVRTRGARTLAIVNRRDSDLTFKTDGVLYTSSGRDIEMSVASTKAFYSQITAGAILGLHIATMKQVLSAQEVTHEIEELAMLPEKMLKVLAMKQSIQESAARLAVTRNYWATVGSGSNKTSADEIRIKLSELCYKTISSDFVEDKKHIDLSSEPLIIICAAGTRESVLGDIIKDTAIFHAHKATPVVITDENEHRFDTCAADVFKVPKVPEHLSPILNTLVGHIWGYYAALSINEGSEFMYAARRDIQDLVDDYTAMGHDVYEVILEKKFRETIAEFYTRFSQKRREKRFPAALCLNTITNITLLLKYLSGRLPVSDFEIDFEQKGTPANMLMAFAASMAEAINTMARPVDAIKHQAKTVTVGTSRISQTFEGVVYDALTAHGIAISQITNRNVIVIKNLQQVISQVRGALLYKVSGLTVLGEPTAETRMEVIRKTGNLENETSRVESDNRLKGTKHIIVREGNVYIGKGRKDGRSILVIPVLSSSSEASNAIEYLLSLNVAFKNPEEVSLRNKITALGGKYTRIKDIVSETGVYKWDDRLLDRVPIQDLFGDSAEKIADRIESIKDR